MKNLFYVAMLVLTAGLTACASDEANNDNRNYRYAGGQGGCGGALVEPRPVPAPAPAPVVAPAPVPVATSCCPTCSCQAREYTVRTPVKVVYKNTTYRTVYEPRTFETTAYETRPYNRAEVCEGNNCGTPALVSQQPM
jgi:hypothetical protein